MFTYHSHAERAAAHQQALRQEAANERQYAALHRDSIVPRPERRASLKELVHVLTMRLTTVLRAG